MTLLNDIKVTLKMLGNKDTVQLLAVTVKDKTINLC